MDRQTEREKTQAKTTVLLLSSVVAQRPKTKPQLTLLLTKLWAWHLKNRKFLHAEGDFVITLFLTQNCCQTQSHFQRHLGCSPWSYTPTPHPLAVLLVFLSFGVSANTVQTKKSRICNPGLSSFPESDYSLLLQGREWRSWVGILRIKRHRPGHSKYSHPRFIQKFFFSVHFFEFCGYSNHAGLFAFRR